MGSSAFVAHAHGRVERVLTRVYVGTNVRKGLRKDAKLRSRAHVGRLADTTIATRLLTTTLNIPEKLVTSKLRAESCDCRRLGDFWSSRCKSHRALNAPGTPNCPPWRNRRSHCLSGPYYTDDSRGKSRASLNRDPSTKSAVCFAKQRRRSLSRVAEISKFFINWTLKAWSNFTCTYKMNRFIDFFFSLSCLSVYTSNQTLFTMREVWLQSVVKLYRGSDIRSLLHYSTVDQSFTAYIQTLQATASHELMSQRCVF